MAAGTGMGIAGQAEPVGQEKMQADTAVVMDYIKRSFSLTIRKSDGKQGENIDVPYPYTVPCATGLFQNLFYWDTYFTNLGLLRTDFKEVAKNNTDNLLFLADKLGYVPNANRWEYSNRSQPPLLAWMVRDIFTETKDLEWAGDAYRVLTREHHFWMTQRLSPTGLNCHSHSATEGELEKFYTFLSQNRFKELALADRKEKLAFSSQSLSEAETGWDFTPRFDRRCGNFCPVDLNANMYACETMLANLARALGKREEGAFWDEQSEKRRKLMVKYLWNEEVGCYTDYDYVNGRQSDLVTCASLFPLWAGVATQEQAQKTVDKTRMLLEYDFGLVACERRSQKYIYQWDYPNGWPPLQCIAIQALDRYGFREDACRIAEKYVGTVVRNFEKTGGMWEKYNVVTGATDAVDEYKMPQMLGWTAGTFVFAVEYLQQNHAVARDEVGHGLQN